MTKPEAYEAVAFNPATNSTNQIHSDTVAKQYGFRGGLVPGVTQSAYLLQPAVLAWDEEWLSEGEAHVVVHKPLYEGLKFRVELSGVTDKAYEAELIDEEGTHCSTAKVNLGNTAYPLPIRRDDKLLPRNAKLPVATPETMTHLKQKGMRALKLRWQEKHEMSTYFKDKLALPEIHQFDGRGFAHAAFMLGITNWVLAGNAYMNPWVHLQTDSRFFGAVPLGANLVAEAEVEDLFTRSGHEFVDILVNVFNDDTQHAVMAAHLRAIYKMRGVEHRETDLEIVE